MQNFLRQHLGQNFSLHSLHLDSRKVHINITGLYNIITVVDTHKILGSSKKGKRHLNCGDERLSKEAGFERGPGGCVGSRNPWHRIERLIIGMPNHIIMLSLRCGKNLVGLPYRV